MTFTLTIHPLHQFRLVLPLHKNHPIELQSKSIGWFLTMVTLLIPGSTFFNINFKLIEDILHHFLKFNIARLISQKQLKNYQTTATNTFMMTRITAKLNFIPTQFTERQ